MYHMLQGIHIIKAAPVGRQTAVVSISFRWHVSIGDWFRPELPQDDLSLHPIKEVRRTPADSGIKSTWGWWPVSCNTTQHYISFCTPIQFAPWNTRPPLMSLWSVLGNKPKSPHQMFSVLWCKKEKKKKRGFFIYLSPSYSLLQVIESENTCWNWSIH